MAFGEVKMLHTLTLSPVGIRFGKSATNRPRDLLEKDGVLTSI